MGKRMNGNYEIIMAVKLPTKKGERECEIVIGDRKTEFEPYVAWHCFGGRSYAWGYYCQTLEEAISCAIDKVQRELYCDQEYARRYWKIWHDDFREE